MGGRVAKASSAKSEEARGRAGGDRLRGRAAARRAERLRVLDSPDSVGGSRPAGTAVCGRAAWRACAYGKEELAKLPNKSCTFYLLPPLVPRRFFGDHLRCCYAPGINGGLGGMGGMGGMPGMGMGQQQGYYTAGERFQPPGR